MTTPTHRQILLQKASVSRRATASSQVPLDKAVQRALSVTARDLWGLVLDVPQIDAKVVLHDACRQVLGDEKLYLTLIAPDKPQGYVVIDADLLACLVESQTIGRVTGAAPEKRDFTNTDAMLSGPFVEEVMQRATMYMDDAPDADIFGGYVVGARIDDARSVYLTMGEQAYQIVSAKVELSLGLRKGDITLLLPTAPPATKSNDDKPQHMTEEMLLDLNVALDAVLYRLKMPLHQLENLRKGDVLPLPKDAIRKVELTAQTYSVFGAGTLGKVEGARAFRIQDDPNGLLGHGGTDDTPTTKAIAAE